MSKSSPYAVSTLRIDENADALLNIKNYLYIIPPIETDFREALQLADVGEIFYLCGSSGDGKSEVLTNLYKEFNSKVYFHLDATHSKGQHSSAIDCLNDLYDNYKSTNKTLAVGINIGMMQKFIKQGAERHSDIKKVLKAFFKNRHKKGYKLGNTQFFDFECYPRIKFIDKKISSEFISEFLNNLTAESTINPFWSAYLEEKKTNSILAKNFELLARSTFKDSLVELLGLTRLYEEQFITPRTFVDFIYQILTLENQDGLIGNLFCEFDNELSRKLISIDPNNHREEGIDDFYLEYATKTLSIALQQDIDFLNKSSGFRLSPQGIVRLAYMLRKDKNLTHLSQKLSVGFTLIEKQHYLTLIDIYSKNYLERSDEDLLLDIVEDILVKAVFKYANRKLKNNNTSFIVSREVKNYMICNKVDIQADLDWIEKYDLQSTDYLPIPLIVNGKPAIIFELDLKVLSLALKICNGFKPNRQELGVLTKFDELIAHIIQKAKDSDSLKVINKNNEMDNGIHISKSGRRYMVERK